MLWYFLGGGSGWNFLLPFNAVVLSRRWKRLEFPADVPK